MILILKKTNMSNKKIIWTWIIAWVLVLWWAAFALNWNSKNIITNWFWWFSQMMKWQFHQKWPRWDGSRWLWPKWMNNPLESFIDVSSLSWDQKTLFDNTMQALKTKHQEFAEKIKSWALSWDLLTQEKTVIENDWKTQMQSLRSLVKQDKLTDFDKFVAAWPQQKWPWWEWFRWMWPKWMNNPLESFIDVSSLSWDQKTLFESTMQALKTKHQEFAEKIKSWALSWDLLTQEKNAIENDWKTQMQVLRPLVKQDKLTDFDKFIAEWPQQKWPWLDWFRWMWQRWDWKWREWFRWHWPRWDRNWWENSSWFDNDWWFGNQQENNN